MPPQDNYALMADHTRRLFLTYDQNAIMTNIPLTADPDYFYRPVLSRLHRISRSEGSICVQAPDGSFLPATDNNTPIVLFDYLCDASPARKAAETYRPTAAFGHMFHTGFAENPPVSSLERRIDKTPDAFAAACKALGGIPDATMGDVSYLLPLFPDLKISVRFWHSDEDFPPQLRFFWDEGSLGFLRYETMYYAQGLILRYLSETLFLLTKTV